jgi:hypothetical protein
MTFRIAQLAFVVRNENITVCIRRITYCVAAKIPYTFAYHEHGSGPIAFVSTGEAPTRSSFK